MRVVKALGGAVEIRIRFQFSIWDAWEDLTVMLRYYADLAFQFSIWDANSRKKSGWGCTSETFNSLFEMRQAYSVGLLGGD